MPVMTRFATGVWNWNFPAAARNRLRQDRVAPRRYSWRKAPAEEAKTEAN